jgi:hypothetical protein
LFSSSFRKRAGFVLDDAKSQGWEKLEKLITRWQAPVYKGVKIAQ